MIWLLSLLIFMNWTTQLTAFIPVNGALSTNSFFIRGFTIFYQPIGNKYDWSISVWANYSEQTNTYNYIYYFDTGIEKPADAGDVLQIGINGNFKKNNLTDFSVTVNDGDWLTIMFRNSSKGQFEFHQVANNSIFYYEGCKENLFGCAMDAQSSFLPCICDSLNKTECTVDSSLLICRDKSVGSSIASTTYNTPSIGYNNMETSTIYTSRLIPTASSYKNIFTNAIITSTTTEITTKTTTSLTNTTYNPSTFGANTATISSMKTTEKIETTTDLMLTKTPLTQTVTPKPTTESSNKTTEIATSTYKPVTSAADLTTTYSYNSTTVSSIPTTTPITPQSTTYLSQNTTIIPTINITTASYLTTSISTSMMSTDSTNYLPSSTNTLLAISTTGPTSTVTQQCQNQPTANYKTTFDSTDVYIIPTYTPPPGDPLLRNLSETTVTLDNVSDVLLEVNNYTLNSADLQSTDIGLVSVTLMNCASVNGLNSTQATDVLLNVDLLLNADPTQFQHSGEQNTVLALFPQLAFNTDSMNHQYLDGVNLGYLANREKDGQNGNGLSDNGHTFTIVNGQTVANTKANTIYFPDSVVEKTTFDSNRTMLVTIFRNRKLFIGKKKYRLLSNDRQVQYEDGDGALPPNPCQRQVQPSQSTPILSAAVVGDNGTTYSTIQGEPVMARIQFDVSKILQSLHGEYEVTWWNETSQEWSTTNQCKVQIKGDVVYADCPHLTGFAMIVNCPANDPKICQSTLTIVSLVINSTSVVCLLLLIMVHIFARMPITRFNNLQRVLRDSKKDNLPMRNSVQLASLSTLFLFFVLFSYFIDGTKIGDTACEVMGPLTYTLLISNICLTMVLTIQTSQNAVMTSKNYSRLTYLVSWIGIALSFVIPIIISILLSFLTESFNRNDGFCWIRPDFIVPAVIFPISCLIINDIMSTIYVLWNMYNIRKHGRRRSVSQIRGQLVWIIMMQINCGLPWIVQYFTLFDRSSSTMDYIFTIIIGLQGFVLALIYLVTWHLRWKKFKSPVKLLHPNPEAIQRYKEVAVGAVEKTGTEKDKDKVNNSSRTEHIDYITQKKQKRRINDITVSIHL